MRRSTSWPRPVIERLAGWFNEISALPDSRTFLQRRAAEAFPGTPESMARLVAEDVERWGRYVKAARIHPQ